MEPTIERRLISDLPFYAEHNLYIKPKVGNFQPFKFNKSQRYLHDRVQEQKRLTGKVRAVVIKGRQQGCSTYIGGRFYHQTVTQSSILTFIFAHDAEASDTLFNMVKNYYDLSDPSFRPELGKSNAKELLFPKLLSGYKVGTAGTKGLGRSKTLQQLHWSEVAYSPNAQDHAAGIVQAVPDAPNTEIFLESTSNGLGDYFHSMVMNALSGETDWMLVFMPWFWQDEYRKPLTDGFELEQPQPNQEFTSEQEYYDTFKKDGLSLEHMVWRRNKINGDFQGDVVRFMREYPCFVEEAFEASSEDSYIKPLTIRQARNRARVTTQAPLIFGVDPSRLGGDKFKICHRIGRNVTKLYTLKPGRVDETAQRLAVEINKYNPTIVNIDCGGLGVGVYDILVGMGYGHVVRKVDFGAGSINPEINKNKRAEMYRAAKDYLEDGNVSIDLPQADGDRLQAQLSLAKAKWIHNSILQILPKEDIKKELGYSPDDSDAFILTFATPVNPSASAQQFRPQTVYADTNWSPF